MAEEKWTCELCDKEVGSDHIHMHEDCWVCSECEAAHRAEFVKCDHKWEPHVNAFGDDAQYCPECFTCVRNEDFPTLFGKEAPIREIAEST